MTTTIDHSADARLPTVAMDDTTDPDPVVPERTWGPRRFPAAYRARILAKYVALYKADTGLPQGLPVLRGGPRGLSHKRCNRSCLVERILGYFVVSITRSCDAFVGA